MSIADRYNKMYPISWDQFHKDVKSLARKIHKTKMYKGLIIITRGGMVPGAILARELNIRVVDTICIVSYDWQIQDSNGSKLLKNTNLTKDGEGWLVVDDLVDTGSTLALARELLPKATFLTIYAKPDGKDLVDYFATEVTQDTWILFPWDSEIQYTKPIIEIEE